MDDEYFLLPRQPPSFDMPETSNHVGLESLIDPMLCITPEKTAGKPLRTCMKDSMITDGVHSKELFPESPKARTGQKVHFDHTIEIKHLSPEMSELGILSNVAERISPVTVHSSDMWAEESIPQQDALSDDDTLQPISVIASDLKRHSSKSSPVDKVTEREQGKDKLSCRRVSEGTTNVLSKPEFNSTLRICREVKQLQEGELDLDAAVKQKLNISDKIKSQIEEKAYRHLNAGLESAQFESLLPVDVKEDALVEFVQKKKAVKAKSSNLSKAKEEEPQNPPDILELFTPDLQWECSSYSLESLPQPECKPRSADLAHAFDVYRHRRSWESWNKQ